MRIEKVPKDTIFVIKSEDHIMGNCAIVGINWGDEGKGRMVDLLTQDYDIVVR